MNNKLEKSFKIIIVVIILIIIIISIIIVSLFLKNKKEEQDYLDTRPYDIVLQKMQENIGAKSYFTIQSCIDKYYNTISALETTNNNTNVLDDNYAKILLNILSKEYASKNNIDVNSLIEKYKNYEFNGFIIKKVYFTQNENNTTTYLVLGKQFNSNSNNSENYGFVLILDDNNSTFSIAPYEFINQLNVNENSDISELVDTSNIEIDDKKSNVYDKRIINDEQVIKFIFNNYKNISKYDPSYAYELLDDNYRNARFVDQNAAEAYLQQNVSKVYGSTIVDITYDDSDPYYTKYMCKDNLGNIIIIQKNDQLMEYSIILDIYTIPIEAYVDSYNKASEAKKTAYQIELFKQMINLKDYNSAFNILDEKFRNNYFGNVESFKEYINNNWYEFITISYDEYKQVEDVNTLSVNIKNRDIINSATINKTFIVKLNDDGSCTMSFNIN